MTRMNIGDLLLSIKAIDPVQLRAMIGHQRRWGTPLGRIAVESGFCSWKQVLYALSLQSGMPAVDLDRHRADRNLAHLIPEKTARQHRAVPLAVKGDRAETLVVAIAAPARLESLDALAKVSRKRVEAYIAADAALERELEVLHGGASAVTPRTGAAALAPLHEQEFELDAA